MKKFRFMCFLFLMIMSLGILCSCSSLGPQGEQGIQGETGPQGVQGEKGEQGRGVVSITLTSSKGLVDTYTITYSDNTTSTFTVTNGQDGNASEGIQGQPGKDGHTPVITIGSNGNWHVDGIDTGVKAKGDKGDTGAQGPQGSQGQPGKDGVDGHTPLINIGENGNWFVDGLDTGVKAQGSVGESGKDGKTAEFRINEGYLEWKYTIDTEWTRLFKLNSNVSETVKVKYVYDYEDELDQNGNPIPIRYEEVEVPLGNIKEPTDVTKEGYRFKGWMYYDEYDEEYKLWKFNYYSLSTNITLYALWEKEYTVTFVGFNGEVIKQEKVVYGETVDCPKISAYEGFRIYWTDNGYEYSNTYTLNKNSDVTLTVNKAPRKLIVYACSSSVNYMKEVASKFEEKYPSWTIGISNIGTYADLNSVLSTSLSCGTQPDLAFCYPDYVADYIRTGKVVDLTKYINSTDEIEYTKEDGTTGKELVGLTASEVADFIPGYYQEGLATNFANYDKYGYESTAMFTLPFAKSTEVLYYNADALIAAGIFEFDANGNKVAKAPTTWDELWEDCAILKELYPKSTPLGYASEANWFITMCEQNSWGYTQATENHYLFNNDNTVNWLKQLKGYYDLGYFITQSEYGSYTSNLFKKGATEGTIFSIDSSTSASYQKSDLFNWGVAPIPGSKVGTKVVNKAISQGPNLVMFTTESDYATEKELMTWEFVKMLLDPAFQCSFSIASGYNPVRQSSFEIDEYVEFLENDANIVAVTANVAKGMTEQFFTSPAFVGSSTARSQVGTALVYAFTSRKTAEKALEDALTMCYQYN